MDITFKQLNQENFPHLLPLVRDYQEFYQVSKIDDNKNRQHFSRFISDTSRGIVYLASLGEKYVGFFTLYFSFSSTIAEEIGILNDLYVVPSHRTKGIGKAAIRHAADEVASRNISRIQWMTAAHNDTAKKLYDSFETIKSDWTLYVLPSNSIRS